MYISKSDGTPLCTHSKYVRLISLHILRNSSNIDIYNKYKKIINISSLLHDIGKCALYFQNFLNSNSDDVDDIKSNKYLHNQIGAAFLSKYLNIDDESKRLIIDSVYWHHGVSNYINSYTEILKNINDHDILSMKDYLISILGEKYLLNEPDINYDYIPNYYTIDTETNGIDKNLDKLLIRSCIIGADRFVSKYHKDELNYTNLNNDINKTYLRTNDQEIINTKYDGTDRFNRQIDICNLTDKTTIVNAVAGFGKTVIGLLWGISKNKKKIVWVCPRNMVAESAYNSILNEINNFNMKMSVELYISGEVKKSNIDDYNGFNSDIIVTNIDNFLFTSINNNKLNYLYLTNDINVVFDEYHELINNSAIMSLFILVMKLRHNWLKSETLLLSATDLPINKLWETSFGQKTKILPDENKHYESVHKKEYLINIKEQPVYGDNTLTIFNSIKESQREKFNTGISILIHSRFEQSKRDEYFDLLINEYGKYSKRNILKQNVIGTHIIQASLDISFLQLNESIMSPQSTLQRIGRCDRWGDYNKTPIINIFNYNSRSENSAINSLYDISLKEKWYQTMCNYDNCYLTLDQLYNIYDNFSINNKNEISSYIRKLYYQSIDNLQKIYPIKILNTRKSDILTAGSNKLRSSGNELFVIYKKYKGDKYTEPFNENEYGDISEQFDENTKTLYNMVKDMIRMDDDRYDYQFLNKSKKIKKEITLEKLRKYAKKSISPYIRYDCVYHDEYGIINIKLLETFN